MEPWDASLVAKELEKSLHEMRDIIETLNAQSKSGYVMSTPVMNHVFFVINKNLLCVPEESVFHNCIDPSIDVLECSPLSLNLSVATRRALIEAAEKWISRPVYSKKKTPVETA